VLTFPLARAAGRGSGPVRRSAAKSDGRVRGGAAGCGWLTKVKANFIDFGLSGDLFSFNKFITHCMH
jgi:hypothetical protein